MEITFDPPKRQATLEERKLDFLDCADVFRGPTIQYDDRRENYGERRVICFGLLHERLVVIGYTPRGSNRHVFSMRKANKREKKRIEPLLKPASSGD